jgi:hypothetical protein
MLPNWFLACWMASLLTLFPAQTRALTAPETGQTQSARVYLNPNTGRFWTMDTFAGDSEDPRSLHRYLYSHDDGVDRIDPSGRADFNIGSLMSTIGNIGYMAANIGLRAAPALTRVTVVIFEATTGESIAIGGGAAITGFAAMSRVQGGIGTWTRAVSQLKGVAFGPYGYLKDVIKGRGGQANHLNQSGAYTAILKQVAGCIEMDGNALVKGTEHNQFHAIMEQFWDPFRKSDKKASNQEYLLALRNALGSVINSTTSAAKYTRQEIDEMVNFAEMEQKGYGYFDGPGGLKPETPSSMNLQ